MALKLKESAAHRLQETQGEITFDDLLVAVGKTRNRDAFIRVFEYYAPRVKSFLMKGGLPQDIADELAQETMLAVWQKAESFDPARASAATWIFTIARNKRTDILRKTKYPEPEDELDRMASGEAAPDEAILQDEESRLLAKAVTALPEDQARLVRKSFFEDMTHADIAAETGLPLGTVKSRIRLALERLRRHYGAGDDDE